MKKFIICFFLLGIGLSCKKTLVCGCVMPVDNFSIVVKNAEGADMLDPKTSGYFSKQAIKVSYKDGSAIKYTLVHIREPFTFGEGGKSKFPYYTLTSSELVDLKSHRKASEFSINFGDQKVHTIRVDDKNQKLSLDGQELMADTSLPVSMGKVHYLVKDK